MFVQGITSRTIAIATAATLALGAVAPAAAQQQAEAPAQARKAQRYCADTEITGSRTRQRECKTREAWIKENGFDPTRADGRPR